MKKLLSMMLALMMIMGVFGIAVFAEDALSASVYVTIADKGALVVSAEKIKVTDIDNDNALTVNDALYAAHEAKYEGGAAAGYYSYTHSEYGLSLGKLWNDDSGNFGFYVNNVSAWSLADPVKEGDYISAFVYSDGEYYSDMYTFFDVNLVSAESGKEITLTLSGAGYDASWNPITVPVADATITVNGKATSAKTDAEGKAIIKIDQGGRYVISAESDSQILVPPVCIATVSSNAAAQVYVTISDKDGKLVLVQEKVTVSDTDKDGYLTINDALYAAHEAKYEGGAAAGYASYYSDYGLSLSKLWGTENGGSYGYYVNNKSALSLANVVKEGDYINAFVYTDLTAWSDTYSFFDLNTTSTVTGKEITLTLSAYGYDADWNTVTLPVEGAAITLNGEKTKYKTDKNGKVTFTLDTAGSFVISAVSDTQTLVPPVCVATVSADDKTLQTPEDNNTEKPIPQAGDNSNIAFFAVLMLASLLAIIKLGDVKKRSYEK